MFKNKNNDEKVEFIYKNQIEIRRYKDEMIKRYCYINDNCFFILGDAYNNEYGKLSTNFIIKLEKLLLKETIMEFSESYAYFEQLKNDSNYLKKINDGLSKLQKYNKENNRKLEPNTLSILLEIYFYIANQTGDLENKFKKLEVIDEYIRIARFANDGKVYSSGFNTSKHDMKDFLSNKTINQTIISLPWTRLDIKKPNRRHEDIGVLNNNFINTFSNTNDSLLLDNSVHLTEKEKQMIYLKYNKDRECNINSNIDNEIYEEEFKEELRNEKSKIKQLI